MASVWHLYHFQVVPTQGAIPEEGKELQKTPKKQVNHISPLLKNIYTKKIILALQD